MQLFALRICNSQLCEQSSRDLHNHNQTPDYIFRIWGQSRLSKFLGKSNLFFKHSCDPENHKMSKRTPVYQSPSYMNDLKGIHPKKQILFILIYVVALSFFFPKWGHMSLNYRNFLFYKHLPEGSISKHSENRPLHKQWPFLA